MNKYKEHGTDLCAMLDGMFSFVLLDTSVTPSRIIAARDPIGITTLYMGYHSSSPDTIYFSSELKTLHEECDNLIAFPPGHFYDSNTKTTTRYFKPTWWDGDKGEIPHNEADLKLVRETLEAAVKKRLMSEVPYGVLLSGGLDSSLIASIAARETDKLAQAQEELRQQKRQAIAEGKPVGELLVPCSVHHELTNRRRDNTRIMAATPLLRRRSTRCTRFGCCPKSCRFPRNSPSRIHLHARRGS
jgi:asparagine synthase (glutamine-hydrolysing)